MSNMATTDPPMQAAVGSAIAIASSNIVIVVVIIVFTAINVVDAQQCRFTSS
jgi:hypothetical protein